MNKKKVWKRIILLTGLILLGIILFMVYSVIDDQTTSSNTPVPEYNNLFSKDAQEQLHILATVRSRNREPISTYTYENKFNICVSKIILSKNAPLSKLISFQEESSYQSMNAVYAGLPSFNFDMNIKSGKAVLASVVHFKYSGDTITSIAKGDSLFCYYFKFKTFSISYNDEPYDIVAHSDKSAISAGLAFIKKDRFLYVIIITGAEGAKEMNPNLIYNLISK